MRWLHSSLPATPSFAAQRVRFCHRAARARIRLRTSFRTPELHDSFASQTLLSSAAQRCRCAAGRPAGPQHVRLVREAAACRLRAARRLRQTATRGSMESAQAEIVILVSAEGHEFPVRTVECAVCSCSSPRSALRTLQVDKRAACMSKAIKNMLAPDSASPQKAGYHNATLTHNAMLRFSGAFLEAKSGKVKFEEIKSTALALVVKFMEYKLKLVNR